MYNPTITIIQPPVFIWPHPSSGICFFDIFKGILLPCPPKCSRQIIETSSHLFGPPAEKRFFIKQNKKWVIFIGVKDFFNKSYVSRRRDIWLSNNKGKMWKTNDFTNGTKKYKVFVYFPSPRAASPQTKDNVFHWSGCFFSKRIIRFA